MLMTTDTSLSINEIIRRIPASVAVLNAYGIDTCCGGEISLAESSKEIGVAPENILRAITAASRAREPR
jgi:iron-sulfur cluster repair protein YtfE (RIC family)